MVGLAAYHLLGEAQLWFYQVESDRLMQDWEEFKELSTIRFGPPAHCNPLGDLVLLRQTAPVELYQKQFQEKLATTSRMVRLDQQVNLFTVGLSESLRLEVELHEPADLARAMNLSRALELRQKVQNRKPAWQGDWNIPTSWQGRRNSNTHLVSQAGQQIRNYPSINPTADTRPNNPPAQYIRNLTSGEMVERKAKNLFYNCDETYRAGHQCKRLVWLQVDEFTDDITEPQ
ncbi:uncharacterized protein [Aristolochia californica]|uniref:uncharacterized protein n=1 Tax=Aristolochia californica TaxID=171875 RepID=UPI0035DD5CFF